MTNDKFQADADLPPRVERDHFQNPISFKIKPILVIVLLTTTILTGFSLHTSSDQELQARMADCNSILGDAVTSSQVGEAVKVKCMHIRWAAHEIMEEQKRLNAIDATDRIMDFDLP